jgi:hypothetical protein
MENGKWKTEKWKILISQVPGLVVTPQTNFFTSVLHIGIRQGAALLELGDLESVASPWS